MLHGRNGSGLANVLRTRVLAQLGWSELIDRATQDQALEHTEQKTESGIAQVIKVK